MSIFNSSSDTTELLKHLWRSISPRRQRQCGLIAVLMVVSAFAEVVSLGAVVPFLGVLMAPERVFNIPAISRVAHYWGIASAQQLVLPFTIAFAGAAVVAGGIRILLLWAGSRLAFAAAADLSIEAYRRTLFQPYQVHVGRNSSDLVTTIRTKTEAVAFYVLLPALYLISSLVLLIAIVVVLMTIYPLVSGAAALTFGVTYWVLSWLSRRELRRNSQTIARDQSKVMQALQEGLGGIREVLLDGSQKFYCEIYRRANYPLWKAQHNLGFFSLSPKYLMETLGILMIAALAYGLSLAPGGITSAIPILGALALGAQRLLPAMQLAYTSWATIIGSQASLADVLELIDQPIPQEVHNESQPLNFVDGIRFENVCFRYSNDGPWVIDDISFAIKKGARVGIIGQTGSGKSTALDLMMGLLEPNQGRILIDGQPMLGSRLRAIDPRAWTVA